VNNHGEFFEAVGYLSNPIRSCKLDAEVAPKQVSQRNFERRYLRLSGITPVVDGRNYYRLHENADKWGVELRIYFNGDRGVAPPSIRDLIVRPRPRGNHDYRINGNGLIWNLIEYGFTLGDSQNLNRIRNRIPAQHRDAFERGLVI